MSGQRSGVSRRRVIATAVAASAAGSGRAWASAPFEPYLSLRETARRIAARELSAVDVPLNPWNHDRWPGMSSSGSGVAVAAGLCFAAVGTDTGGSIRMPSSANGVVGLKPTYGRVSRYGVMAMAESLDHVGPLAREGADAALMFDAMARHDPSDPTSLDAAPA